MKGTQTVRRRFLYIGLHIMFLLRGMLGGANATDAEAAAPKPAIDQIVDAYVAQQQKDGPIVFFFGEGTIPT